MSPAINRELERFGRRLTAWRVELLLMWGGAALFAAAALAGYADFVLRAGHFGRWGGFLVLVLLCAGIAALAARILRRRITPEGLAAVIEHAYPELDNHLINYVQFSRAVAPDPLTSAYVRSEAPPIHKLEVARMKDRRRHRQGAIALSASALLLIGPFFVLGGHWATALLRMVNPMSPLQPVTLTRILAVEPGSTDKRQGESAVLTVRVQGMRGHTVRVDVTPDDGLHTVYELGRISADEPQSFSHRLPQVNTRFRYRFRAGDAVPSAWYTVTPRPPPALSRIRAMMTAPAYTRLPPVDLDLSGPPPVIPAGASLTLQAVCTVPMSSLTAALGGEPPAEMLYDASRNAWEHTLVLEKPGVILLAGTDPHGQSLQETLPYVIKADTPPVIEVLAPQGRVELPPGEFPQIEFRVVDDYGLSTVYLESIAAGKAKDADGEPVEHWETGGTALLQQTWRGTAAPRQTATAYRIVAVDNAGDSPQMTRSSAILFNVPPSGRRSETRDRLESDGLAGLQQVIDLQKQNIEHCRLLQQPQEGADANLWREPEERQREIRTRTRSLLANPVRPLGGRTEAVSRLYANEMLLAIDTIGRAGAALADRREQAVGEAIAIQTSILRQLQAAENAANKAQVDRRQTGVSAMLTALIEEQSGILEQVKSAGFALFASLSARQDTLSEDLVAFEAACEKDAAAVRGNDAPFADLLVSLVRESRERRIREDMLVTAERLEQKALEQAVPPGNRALENLKHLQGLLDRVGLQRQQGEREVMMEALGQAQEKLARLQDMHSVILQSMDTIRGSVDKDTEMFDVLAEEFMEILKKNKQTLLAIPVDLHIFTDLNVGNELVEDVFAVFEEIEQKKGSEKQTAEDLQVFAYAKNLEALEMMREMKDRMDDMEMWLMDKPEMAKVLTEALDREEMPEEGVALGALAAQMEDLIGDLVEENEEMDDLSQDSAVNHAAPDLPMGWDVMEGDISTFSAKGKSGNQTPDHKEQDGRSNVGRQGMAVGETAAGSGTIGEGDKNIEERRTEEATQSGKVELDGEADTKATGGGKLGSGKADDVGMEGGVKRMDSTEEGSAEGMAGLMARQADAVFAQASLKNVRVDSLKTAAHHLRQADDAIAKGDIARVSEHRKLAVAALRRAQAELAAPPSGAIQVGAAPSIVQDAVQSGPDFAPPKYQAQVADYYKLLNEEF